MLTLVPYSQKHRDTSVYNPFRMFDELEKSFFGSSDIAEFKTDIRDEGDHYLMKADLPGFRKEDIHVDLDNNTLTIGPPGTPATRSPTRRAATSAASAPTALTPGASAWTASAPRASRPATPTACCA